MSHETFLKSNSIGDPRDEDPDKRQDVGELEEGEDPEKNIEQSGDFVPTGDKPLGLVDLINHATELGLEPEDVQDAAGAYLDSVATSQPDVLSEAIPEGVNASNLNQFVDTMANMEERMLNAAEALRDIQNSLQEISEQIVEFLNDIIKLLQVTEEYLNAIAEAETDEDKTQLAQEFQDLINGFPDSMTTLDLNNLRIRDRKEKRPVTHDDETLPLAA